MYLFYGKKNKLSRRKILSGVGTSIAVASFSKTASASGVKIQDEDTIDIVTIRQGDDPVKRENVPKKWWKHITQIRQKQEKLSSTILNNDSVISVGRKIDDRSKTQGNNDRKLSVKLEKGEELSTTIPRSINNVPIEVEKFGELKEECSDEICNDNTYDPIPGGAQLSHEDVPCYFTATCKVNVNGDPRLMTTSHAYIDSCSDSVSKETTQTSDIIGSNSSNILDYDHDFTVVKNESSQVSGFKDSVLHTKDGKQLGVSGHVTEDGIDYYTGDTFYKYGTRTCRTDGPLTSVDDGGKCSDSPDIFYTDIYSDSNDSGAPHYRVWEDDGNCDWAAILGVHIGSPSGSNKLKAYGCTAYSIKDYWADPARGGYDIEFGPDWNGPCLW